jgi:hypothetical protein
MSVLPLQILNGVKKRFVSGTDFLGLGIGGVNADLTLTGGAGFVFKQTASGGAVTVAALVAGDLPSHSATLITSGVLANAVGGTGANTSATGGTGQIVKQLTAGGAFTVAVLAVGDIPNLPATILTSGQVNLAQLGSGTPAAGKYVDGGSGAWTTIVPATENISLTNNEATSFIVGNVVYTDTSATCKKAKADAAGTAGAIGFALTATAAAGTATVQTAGTISLTTGQWDAVTGQTGGLTAGALYFVDPTTAGKITTTAPNATGQFCMQVGRASSTTIMIMLQEGPYGL